MKPFGEGDIIAIMIPNFPYPHASFVEQLYPETITMADYRNSSHAPLEPQFDPRYPLPHPDNLDSGMEFVLNLHNPAMSTSLLSAPSHLASNPSLCSWDTAPVKARIMWMQGLGGRSGLGKQGSLIEQLAKVRRDERDEGRAGKLNRTDPPASPRRLDTRTTAPRTG